MFVYGWNMQADAADGKRKADDWGSVDDVHTANYQFSEKCITLGLAIIF